MGANLLPVRMPSQRGLPERALDIPLADTGAGLHVQPQHCIVPDEVAPAAAVAGRPDTCSVPGLPCGVVARLAPPRPPPRLKLSLHNSARLFSAPPLSL